MAAFDRIIWIVLDSVGIGELPDAAEYGDVGRNTLGHIARSRALALPNLVRLGLANIAPLEHLAPPASPEGCFGKGATHSPGKDTTTGHWEMAGIWLPQAFPVYKHGFPRELIEQFERAIGRKTIGNKPASGTEIIKELGEEHVRTGFPIVYTSGDSVFQIAAHEDVIPIAELYRMCEIARKMLDGPHRVGRVIARPFTGTPGNFRRTERRHDYAVEPPRPMLLDVLAERSVPVFGIGKIHDIYNGRGVDHYVTTKNNADGMQKLHAALGEQKTGLIFANLVDFDMLYGHRKDVEGFAKIARGIRCAARAVAARHGAARPADDHRRSRLRSRSRVAHDGPFARIRSHSGASARQGSAASTSACGTRWPTWARPSPKISAARFLTARVSCRLFPQTKPFASKSGCSKRCHSKPAKRVRNLSSIGIRKRKDFSGRCYCPLE